MNNDYLIYMYNNILLGKRCVARIGIYVVCLRILADQVKNSIVNEGVGVDGPDEVHVVVLVEGRVVDNVGQDLAQIGDILRIGEPIVVRPVESHGRLHVAHIVGGRLRLVVVAHVVAEVVELLELAVDGELCEVNEVLHGRAARRVRRVDRQTGVVHVQGGTAQHEYDVLADEALRGLHVAQYARQPLGEHGRGQERAATEQREPHVLIGHFAHVGHILERTYHLTDARYRCQRNDCQACNATLKYYMYICGERSRIG